MADSEKRKPSWYVQKDGKVSGPHSSKKLKRGASTGKLSRDDLIRRGADGQWRVAGSLKGLFPGIAATEGADSDDSELQKKNTERNLPVVFSWLIVGITTIGLIAFMVMREPATSPGIPVAEQSSEVDASEQKATPPRIHPNKKTTAEFNIDQLVEVLGNPKLAEGGDWAHAINPNRQAVALSANGNHLNIWDIASGSKTLELRDLEWGVRSASFSPDGKHIAIGHNRGVITVHDLKSGRVIQRMTQKYAYVVSVAFHPSGRTIVTNGARGVTNSAFYVNKWDVVTARLTTLPIKLPKGKSLFSDVVISDMRYSPDGETLAITMYASNEKESETFVSILDSDSGRELKTLSFGSNGITSLTYTPKGQPCEGAFSLGIIGV